MPIINGIAFDCLDHEGRLDWLRKHLIGHDDDGPIHSAVRANELMVCGRQERLNVREARGI